MKNLLILFGGASSEYEVSLRSAASVIRNVPGEKYRVITVGITADGRWLFYDGDTESIENDTWQKNASCVPAVLCADAPARLMLTQGDGVEYINIDVVFPVLHGKNGEDGTVQGLFELSGVPYVGCGVLSSAMCMDKAITNAVADISGIAQAKWLSVKKHEYDDSPEAFCGKAAEYLGFPLFVKPANAGSSVGISKVKGADGLREAMEKAFAHDTKVVLEEGILGREIECAVLGNTNPCASTPGEVVPCNEFYDYEAKYIDGDSALIIPAKLPAQTLDEIRRTAVKAYTALDCSGLARVDFFVRNSDSAVLLNELNTIPGFTSISMYAKLWESDGLPYGELVDKLITLALERKS
ncbi:MAG: D-alanine--D-alanine ligase [Clostridiales bacterium]|nr:D-alanine--D-alanine ligase [Clostridiales bacterium]